MLNNDAFDLLDLRLLLRAAQAGSLSTAARALSLTPAAGSRRLAALEGRLGVRLFARTTRRLRPTPEGEALLPHAERILAAVADAEAAVTPAAAGRTRELSGILRLTAPATFGRKVLAPILAEFLGAHPVLRLDLLLTDSVLDLVESGRDAAIRIAPLTQSSLIARRLAPNRRVLCAAPGYIARRGMPGSATELARHDGLLLEGVEAWSLMPAGGGPAQRVRLVPRMSSNSNEALREACLAGLGIGLHSTWDIGDNLRRGELMALPESLGVPEALGIWLVYPGASAAAAPARLRALADLLAARFTPSPPWER